MNTGNAEEGTILSAAFGSCYMHLADASVDEYGRAGIPALQFLVSIDKVWKPAVDYKARTSLRCEACVLISAQRTGREPVS